MFKESNQNHDHSSTMHATASFAHGNGRFPPVRPASVVRLLPTLDCDATPMSTLRSLNALEASMMAVRRFLQLNGPLSRVESLRTEAEESECTNQDQFLLRLREHPTALSVVHHDA